MENLPIQPYDIFMLVVLALATIFGAWKGMAWQLASLASLVASAVVALRFSGSLAPYLSDQDWAPFAAMLILYLATSLAIWLLFRLVAGAIDRLKLKEFDHQIGGLFGLAKGIALCVVITFFAVTLSESARQSVIQTRSGRAVSLLIRQGKPLMPEKARALVGKYLDDLDRKLNQPPAPAEGVQDPAPGRSGRGSTRLPKLEFPTDPPNPWHVPTTPGSESGRQPAEGTGFSGNFASPGRT